MANRTLVLTFAAMLCGALGAEAQTPQPKWTGPYMMPSPVNVSDIISKVIVQTSPQPHIQIIHRHSDGVSRASMLKKKNGTPADMAGRGCTFFEHPGGGGADWKKPVAWKLGEEGEWEVYAQYVTTVGEWWDNKISSVKCDAACGVQVFEHPDKGGNMTFIYNNNVVTLPPEWQDKISSFVVYCSRHK